MPDRETCPECGSGDVEDEGTDEHPNGVTTWRMRCRACEHFWLVNEVE